jgi:hypothetical protein
MADQPNVVLSMPRGPTALLGPQLSSGCRRRLQRHSTSGELLGEVNRTSAWDLPIEYLPAPDCVPTNVHAVIGDYTLACVGVRRDPTYNLLDQAVITSDTGAIIYTSSGGKWWRCA